MKIFNFCVLCIVLSLFFGVLLSCPTCIGRLSQDSPPFFSDEAYQLEETKSSQVPTRTEIKENNTHETE